MHYFYTITVCGDGDISFTDPNLNPEFNQFFFKTFNKKLMIDCLDKCVAIHKPNDICNNDYRVNEMNDCIQSLKRFIKLNKDQYVNINFGGNRYANITTTQIPNECDYQENKQ